MTTTAALPAHAGSVGATRRVRAALAASPSFADGASYFYAGSLVFNASGVGFHLLTSRRLGVPSYGALGSLLGILLVLQVPIGSMEVAITRRIAATPVAMRGQLSVRRTLAQAAAIAAVVCGGLCVGAPVLASYLHLASVAGVFALAAVIAASFANLVPRSSLLAERRFRRVGAAYATAAVGRFAVGPVLVSAGLGIPGALVGIAAGELGAGVVLWTPVLPALRRRRGQDLVLRAHDVVVATAAFAGFWAMIGIDTVLVRHLVAPRAAGLYAASATAARAGVFLPAAIAMAAFPRFAAADATGAERARALRHALVLVGSIASLTSVVLCAAPHLVISVAFGGRFAGSGTTLVLLAVGATAMSLVQVLVFYLLSTMSKAALLCWGGVAAIAVVATLVPDPTVVAGTVAATAGVLFAATLTAAMRQVRYQRQPHGRTSSPRPRAELPRQQVRGARL